MSASLDTERMPQRQLGELMRELGLITDEQLATALEVQSKLDRLLGQVIVELGFASGAAVAHALAMQQGGALKTEHGFALGLGPTVDGLAANGDPRADIPKLRLAPSASPPAPRPRRAPPAAAAAGPALAPTAPAPAPAGLAGVSEPEPELRPNEQPRLPVPARLEQLETEAKRLERALAHAQTEHEQELSRLEEERERTTVEGEQLRAQLERLEAELAEVRRSDEAELRRAGEERARMTADLESLHAAQIRAQAAHEQELSRLAAERDRATADLDRVQATLDRLLEAVEDPVPEPELGADAPGTVELAAAVPPRTEAPPGDDPAEPPQEAVTRYHAALQRAYNRAGLDEPPPPSPLALPAPQGAVLDPSPARRHASASGRR